MIAVIFVVSEFLQWLWIIVLLFFEEKIKWNFQSVYFNPWFTAYHFHDYHSFTIECRFFLSGVWEIIFEFRVLQGPNRESKAQYESVLKIQKIMTTTKVLNAIDFVHFHYLSVIFGSKLNFQHFSNFQFWFTPWSEDYCIDVYIMSK